MNTPLRILTASVWLYFGPGCKWFGLGTDHRRLVATILGEDHATVLTILIGSGEALLAGWILSNRAPRLCLGTQIVVILTMNVIEWVRVRELLLLGDGNFLLASTYCLFLAFLIHRENRSC